jgi:hypothetical protein
MVNNRIWTPSTPYENEVATQLLSAKGMFKDQKGLSLSIWLYGADPRADGSNLFKLVEDAAVKAGMFDDDNIKVICYGSWESRPVDHESNPFPGKPSTRIRVGDWRS